MYHELDGRINADTGILTSDPPLKYCSQGNNDADTLVECDAATHLPLNQDGAEDSGAAQTTNTAQMAWQYARSQPNFHQNFVAAWLKLMTVPANDDESLTDFTYGYRCVDRDGDGTKHPACVGDIFGQNCEGFNPPASC